MSGLRYSIGVFLVAASLSLYGFTVYCFIWQPDRFAAFSVLPIWVWGGGGLILASVAGYFLRHVASWIMAGVWCVTLLLGTDEARVLRHWGKAPPRPGAVAPHAGRPVLRVATLNCALFQFGNPAPDLTVWSPDIVLLQDAYPGQVARLARALYGESGQFRAYQSNGIISRWKIQRDVNLAGCRDQLATIALPDGTSLLVANVHLATAATDLRFWQRTTWCGHRINRAVRLQELARVKHALTEMPGFGQWPVIFGGDFNAPASDVVDRQVRAAGLNDAFAVAGTGWGDTFHRRFPILRIDRMYASSQLTAVRCRAVMTPHSDHRMVIADFVR